jgi:imidazoleglycerol-phosphate dehydratase
MTRQSIIRRKTFETDITLQLNLDGTGKGAISTGIGFFDHLLETLKLHSGFDMAIDAKGDLHVDDHHTIEDVGIALGQAIRESLGENAYICRYGHAYCPLDESLARAVVDACGRGYFGIDCSLAFAKVGTFSGEMFPEFLRALALNGGLTLHVSLIHGSNQHHALEAMMKSVARALRMAFVIDEKQAGVPSTKGTLI